MRRLSLKTVLLTVWEELTDCNEIQSSLNMDLLPTGMKRGKVNICGSLVIRRNEQGKATLVALNVGKIWVDSLKNIAKASEDVNLLDILDNSHELEAAIQRVIERQEEQMRKYRSPGAVYSSPANLLKG